MTASPSMFLVGNQWAEIHTIWGMSAMGRFLPVATLLSDRQLLGGSSHSYNWRRIESMQFTNFRFWPYADIRRKVGGGEIILKLFS